MISRFRCESCGASPTGSGPADGDTGRPGPCVACGGAFVEEVRCPWCAGWSTGTFCRSCGCKLVPAASYGVARMLKADGATRLTLERRLQSLTPSQLESLAAIHARQADRIAVRVEEARFCEGYLLLPGWAEVVEDGWMQALPLREEPLAFAGSGPQGPFTPGADDLLETIAASSPDELTAALASIALLRLGRVTEPRVESARKSLHAAEPIGLALEAAMALGSWRMREVPTTDGFVPRLGPDDLRRVADVARPALEDPLLRPWAAAACSLADPEDPSELDGPLREGLEWPDPDLAFSCALALGHEATLAAVVDEGVSPKLELALTSLARRRSPRVARWLASGPEELRIAVLRGLRHPVPVVTLEALLQGTLRADDAYREAAFRWLRGDARFADFDQPCRAFLGRFVMGSARALGLDRVLDLLTWATEPPADPAAGPRDDVEVSQFAAAATSAIGGLRPEERAACAMRPGFERWLLNARSREAGALLDELVADEMTADPTLRALLVLHARCNPGGRATDLRAIQILMGIWDRSATEARLTLASRIAVLLIDPTPARTAVFEALWDRFRTRIDERDAVLVALSGFPSELLEARDRDLPGTPLKGTDAAASFRVQYRADPGRLYELVGRVLDRIRSEETAPLADSLFDAVETGDADVVKRLGALGRFVEDLVPRFNQNPTDTGLAQALERFERRWRNFHAHLLASLPKKETSAAPFRSSCERIDESLRMVGDVRIRARARAEATSWRAAVSALAAEKQNAAVREAEAAALIARRADEQLRALVQDRLANAVAPAPAPTPAAAPAPASAGLPLDAEPILPDQPVKSLGEYVRLMKAVMSGGDLAETIRQSGMSAERYAACLGAWATVLTERPEVAARFAQMLRE